MAAMKKYGDEIEALQAELDYGPIAFFIVRTWFACKV
jgi:hypothetical protein